jgi:molybdopterin converting factor subunit 1
MKCSVLLFAHLRESIGRDRLTIQLSDGATVADAVEQLSREHEIIRTMQGRIAVAVDEKYQSANTKLHDGCTIALIPPVSGG